METFTHLLVVYCFRLAAEQSSQQGTDVVSPHQRGETFIFWQRQVSSAECRAQNSLSTRHGQSLYPRMLQEFQFQLSNRVSLELSTGGESLQDLLIARRFQTVLLNSVNSVQKNPTPNQTVNFTPCNFSF